MERHRPLVSVIVPAYNAEATIAAAIESILGQTYRDFEVIVVDDGSTDKTPEIVASLQDERVHYIYQQNAERAVARNRGIAEAKGEYLAFLDADDQWLERKLEKQLALFENNQEIGLVYCDLYYFDSLTDKDIAQYSRKYSKLHRGMVLPELLRFCFIQSPTPMIRRSVLEDREWFDPELPPIEDWDLWLRITAKSLVNFVPEPLARYRFHDYLDNWRKSPEALLTKTLRIYNKLSALFPEESQRRKSSFARGRALGYYNYGLALMLNGKFEKARQGLFRSLKLDPMFLKVYIRILQTELLRIKMTNG